jgi:hypothetical protein
MEFFGKINKKPDAAALVKRGLADERMANRKQIMACLFFWQTAQGASD